MSWNVELLDAMGQSFESSKKIQEGGNIQVGGTTQTILNVTYNYSYFFGKEIDSKQGIDWLDGKAGKETEEVLAKAIKGLEVRTENNYWSPTPGNAGFTLSILLGWAKEFPQGVWKVF